MRKNIGEINTQNSNYNFPVQWDDEDKTSWIGVKMGLSNSLSWIQIGIKVYSEKNAISIAQKHIDFQYGDRY